MAKSKDDFDYEDLGHQVYDIVYEQAYVSDHPVELVVPVKGPDDEVQGVVITIRLFS